MCHSYPNVSLLYLSGWPFTRKCSGFLRYCRHRAQFYPPVLERVVVLPGCVALPKQSGPLQPLLYHIRLPGLPGSDTIPQRRQGRFSESPERGQWRHAADFWGRVPRVCGDVLYNHVEGILVRVLRPRRQLSDPLQRQRRYVGSGTRYIVRSSSVSERFYEPLW